MKTKIANAEQMKVHPAEARLEVQFLPRRGSWVTLKSDPRTGTLEARVLGSEKP